MKKQLILMLFIGMSVVAGAYDFAAKSANDSILYYNYLGGDSVEITHNGQGSYSGVIKIPSLVNDGASPFRVTGIGDYAFHECNGLESLLIPNSVSIIEFRAFKGCSSMISIVIPSSVLIIDEEVFYDCSSLSTVYCKATNPPTIADRYGIGFGDLGGDSNFNRHLAILHVPYKVVEAYKSEQSWSFNFATIKGFVEVIPTSETSVDLTWIPIDDVEQYHIMIYDDTTHTSLIREYYVNADGKQVQPQNDGNAPTAHTPNFIIQQKKDTTYSTDELYVLTIEDLSPDVVYSFVIEGCNAEHKVIYHETGTFQTKQPNKDDGVSYLGVNCEWNYVNGELQITEEASSNIYIYTIDGQLIYRKRTSNCTIALPSGLYIIRINGKAQKVVL